MTRKERRGEGAHIKSSQLERQRSSLGPGLGDVEWPFAHHIHIQKVTRPKKIAFVLNKGCHIYMAQGENTLTGCKTSKGEYMPQLEKIGAVLVKTTMNGDFK